MHARITASKPGSAFVVVVDGERHLVGEGSTLFYSGSAVHEYRNEIAEAVTFYIVIDETGAR